MATRDIIQGISVFLMISALICLLTALSTNHWLVITVRDDLDKTTEISLVEYNRHRGIFMECFGSGNTDVSAKVLGMTDWVVSNQPCLSVDFNNKLRSKDTTSDFNLRRDLFYAMASLLCLSGIIVIASLCVWASTFCVNKRLGEEQWKTYIKISGILLFVAAFLTALAMAFFHGCEYLEMNKIQDEGNTLPYISYFRSSQPPRIYANTSRSYSYSYVLGWVTAFLQTLSGCLVFFSSICCTEESSTATNYQESGTMASGFGHRNMAYNYVDPKVKTIDETVPENDDAQSDDYYRNHSSGKHYDPYSKGSVKRDIVPTFNYDEGWRMAHE